ncbi:unnamed protein product, partial [Dovyalis caffra]
LPCLRLEPSLRAQTWTKSKRTSRGDIFFRCISHARLISSGDFYIYRDATFITTGTLADKLNNKTSLTILLYRLEAEKNTG